MRIEGDHQRQPLKDRLHKKTNKPFDQDAIPRRSKVKKVAGIAAVGTLSAIVGAVGVPWALHRYDQATEKKCRPTGEVVEPHGEPRYQVVERKILSDALQSPDGKSNIDEGCTLINDAGKSSWSPIDLFTRS